MGRDQDVFKTVLCDLLNIEYPLIQSAMAWIAGEILAAAVSGRRVGSNRSVGLNPPG